jgi:hypothetical protein
LDGQGIDNGVWLRAILLTASPDRPRCVYVVPPVLGGSVRISTSGRSVQQDADKRRRQH